MYVLVNFWNRNIWNLIVFTFIKLFGLNYPNKHKCFISRWKDGKIMKDTNKNFTLWLCLCLYFYYNNFFFLSQSLALLAYVLFQWFFFSTLNPFTSNALVIIHSKISIMFLSLIYDLFMYNIYVTEMQMIHKPFYNIFFINFFHEDIIFGKTYLNIFRKEIQIRVNNNNF